MRRQKTYTYNTKEDEVPHPHIPPDIIFRSLFIKMFLMKRQRNIDPSLLVFNTIKYRKVPHPHIPLDIIFRSLFIKMFPDDKT